MHVTFFFRMKKIVKENGEEGLLKKRQMYSDIYCNKKKSLNIIKRMFVLLI